MLIKKEKMIKIPKQPPKIRYVARPKYRYITNLQIPKEFRLDNPYLNQRMPPEIIRLNHCENAPRLKRGEKFDINFTRPRRLPVKQWESNLKEGSIVPYGAPTNTYYIPPVARQFTISIPPNEPPTLIPTPPPLPPF